MPPATPKKMASARPRSPCGKAETTMARAAGNMIAAPKPWMIRKTISHVSPAEPLGAAPQRADATVKMTIPMITMRL